MTDDARRRCENNWPDGTCPQCGATHYIIVRRGAIEDAVAQAVKEREGELDEAWASVKAYRIERDQQAEEIARLKEENRLLKNVAPITTQEVDYVARLRAYAAVLASKIAHKGTCVWLADGIRCDCGAIDEALRVGKESDEHVTPATLTNSHTYCAECARESNK